LKVPKGLALRDYQKTGVEHLLSGQKKLLLDDMGLGKTAQSVVAFNTLGAKRVLITCPPAVKYGWQRELSVWSERDYQVQVIEGGMDKIEMHDRMVIICPFSYISRSDFMVRQLKSIRWGVTIADEIHRCKSMDAKLTKAIMSKTGIISNSVYFWGLSGTLMPNTPKDLIVPFLCMGKNHLGKYNDWFKFTGRYCQRWKTPWGGWDISGAKNLDELSTRLFDTGFAVQRFKEDVAKELPGKQYTLLPMRGSGRMSVEVESIMKKADLNSENLGLGAGDLATLRREVGERKVWPAFEYILSLVEKESRKLVVFAWHKSVIAELSETLDRYGLKHVTYTGSMSPTKKEEARAEFIEGDAQLFIANIGSGGTGLDGLQHVCSHAVFLETPWTYTEIAQASDRLDRIGQTDMVNIDILVMQDEVEHYILDKVLTKEGYFNEVFKRTQTITGD